MIDVTLTKEEQLMCQEKAEARYNIARELGLKQLRIDTSPLNVELLGVQGEMAFAKLFNLHTPMVEHGADSGWDYEINGITIDVKTASKPHYRLIFRELPAFKAKVAVLVVKISEDVFRIKGWVSKQNFINWSKPMDKGGFSLEDEFLRQIQNLWLNAAAKGLQ
jgi:hypothetical protein